MKKLLDTLAFICFCGVVGVIAGVIVGTLVKPVVAQDTAPTWEYAMMFYSTDDVVVFTDDPTETNALNKLFNEDGESVDLLAGLNVMGGAGWELLYQQGSPQIVYVFRRPLE